MNSPKFKPPSLSFLDEEMEEEHEVLLNLCVSNSDVLAYFATQTEKSVRKGSIPGYIVINRGRIEGNTQLWNDYFSANPTFGEDKFGRRFRMRRPLFLRIVKAVKNHDNFFIVQKKDALGRLGLSTLQKITAVLRVLAYGTPADSTDEYLRIGESTTILCVKRFCRAIVKSIRST
ncbi:hypothetical protein Vadar_019630 [Vaccinium darrowii]|uniref:Uncharacterized protein n=1 Tax=Vaccinium darrowii TaxID=229202 RepID=A0ACB7YEQ4_9ERIC|nr:hypothetical protein Vadar_019630 [Vaccinium darrowii]